MVKYKLQELEDCFVIMASHGITSWYVEAEFELKEYAEAFTKILNKESIMAYDKGKFDLRQEHYNNTGKLI